MSGTYCWAALSAKTVANYFLELGRRDGVAIDPLKLQKLVYLAHGWSLQFLQKPLIKEPFEAWRYGPVVPVLYQEFRRFGGSPITDFAGAEPGESTNGIEQQTKSLLDAVWERYKTLTPIQLSMLTHEPGYAWDLAQRGPDFLPWGARRIPNEFIADEFARRQQQAQ